MTAEPASPEAREVGEITRLLEKVREGKPEGAEELLSHVYHQLRALAASRMAREAPGQTLQTTALVHEAWLRLGLEKGARFPDRAYFFAAAGEAMRRILVEIARRKKRLKHGGGLIRVAVEEVDFVAPQPEDELLAVDEVLDLLAESEPRAAELVKLLYFIGFSQEEAARELGVSVATVERTWAYARAWLARELQRGKGAPPDPRKPTGAVAP